MNLHALAVGCIKAVHNTEVCTIYQSEGQVNIKGRVTQKFREPFNMECDIQPLSPQDLQQFQPADRDTKIDWKIYLYSNNAFPISSVRRLPIARGGDFVKRANGRWYLITVVMEDWQDEGWACVGAVEQKKPPDLE